MEYSNDTFNNNHRIYMKRKWEKRKFHEITFVCTLRGKVRFIDILPRSIPEFDENEVRNVRKAHIH